MQNSVLEEVCIITSKKNTNENEENSFIDFFSRYLPHSILN